MMILPLWFSKGYSSFCSSCDVFLCWHKWEHPLLMGKCWVYDFLWWKALVSMISLLAYSWLTAVCSMDGVTDYKEEYQAKATVAEHNFCSWGFTKFKHGLANFISLRQIKAEARWGPCFDHAFALAILLSPSLSWWLTKTCQWNKKKSLRLNNTVIASLLSYN